MHVARRHRAIPTRTKPGAARGIAQCLESLREDAPALAPEQCAAIERELANVPYRERAQGELDLPV